MKRRLEVCFFTIALFAVSFVCAQEKCLITRYSGEKINNAEITDMDADTIRVTVSGSTEKIPVGDVASVKFNGEPSEMEDVRTYLTDARYEDMLDVLKQIDPNQLTSGMKQDCRFLIVRAVVGRAMSGSISYTEAVKELEKYLKNDESKKFYRYYEAMEIYGNLNLLIGTEAAMANAKGAFGVLEKAKGAPILKARGLLGSGAIAIQEKRGEDAEKAYKDVMTMVKNQELEGVKTEMEVAATCGLARAAVLAGSADAAIKSIKALFASNKVSPEDQLNAQLYNALGFAYLNAKKPKDAAVAYMYTHLLFNKDKQLHVEAIDALIVIFRTELRDETRARTLEAAKNALYGSKK